MSISDKEHERRMVFAREEAGKAWYGEKTIEKVMDTDLAMKFAEILVKHMYAPHLGCASTRELFTELEARQDDMLYRTMDIDDNNREPQTLTERSRLWP